MSSNLHKTGSNEPHPLFYIFDDGIGNKQQKDIEQKNSIILPKRKDLILQRGQLSDGRTQKLSIPSKLELKSQPNSNIDDILKFPIESSHSYSYAHISPNSLALRLNVLKRSLEILKDRPNLFKSIQNSSDIDENISDRDKRCSSVSLEKLENLNIRMYNIPQENHSSESFNEKYHLESNASSAALNAFFRPQIKRSDSMPVNQLYGSKYTDNTESIEKLIQNSDLEDVIKLLGNDYNVLLSNSEVASTLHNLSLTSNGSHNTRAKQNFLKNKLLYALSMPFIENSAITSSLLGGQHEGQFQSTTTLNLLATPTLPNFGSMNNNSRPFHSISSAKHSTPQSIFTVEVDNPWLVKAANDLACLMFGVLKAMIKSLTLMDLIASQFRNFVTEKLMRATNNIKPRNREKIEGSENSIIFAGEIVAISRPGDKGYAWTSMWAKKKNKLIICMFEQIPCDAFDVVILSDRSMSLPEEYKIESISEIAGSLSHHLNFQTCKKVGDISETLSKQLNDENAVIHGDTIKDVMDSESINKTRYYTLSFANQEHMPCAITSNPLEFDNNKNEIKLKIHSLPYIAGIFVIGSENHKIISCNNAIAKNLFGRSSAELDDQSINYIIPNFTEILNLGLNQTKELDIVPGLVLPEHFFRRFDAVLNCQRGAKKNEEDLFLTSPGIVGKHRDGKQILVDVQLRVSPNDIFVLWITYSRSVIRKQTTESIEDKSNNSHITKSILEKKGPKKVKYEDSHDDFKLGFSLPSQLKLFDDNSTSFLDFDSDNEIARKSSTRRPKSSLFIKPILETNEESINEQTNPISDSNPNDHSTIIESSKYENKNEVDVPSYRIINSVSRKFSEDQILRLEDDTLKLKEERSTHWPTVVGEKRRTKKFIEFTVIKDMGAGAYGKVVLAQHKEDPEYKIIIKCIDKERILVDTWVRDRKLGTIPSEIQIMAYLNNEPHPNIMRILDFFEDLKYYYLETPIFGDPPAIDLFDFIEVKKDMKEMECKFIFKQVVMAVYHLHKNGIVHRDIKDENVIVDENGIIKLIDFGSAGFTRQGPFDVFVGTIDYASPEVLRGEKYEGKAQDVWALGILLYTMLYKENPFYNVDEIMEGDLRIPFIISESSTTLIKKILVRDVEKRVNITDIVEDEWLRI